MAVNLPIRRITKKSKRRSIERPRSEYRRFIPYPAQRVFIHELGHYVADTINYKRYGMRSVKRIEIYSSPALANDYEGETKISSDNARAFKPSQRMLPIYFAALAYGCLFESAYINLPDMSLCMRDHGRSDIDKRNEFVKNSEIKRALSAATDAHYQTLIYSGLGKYLRAIVVNRYVRRSTPTRIYINIRLLRADQSSWMRRHAASYLKLVNEFERILK